MGYVTTLGYAEAVGEGVINLEGALAQHLSFNFFPGLPTDFVQPLAIALRNVQQGYENDPVRLPIGLASIRPRTAFVEEGDLYIKSLDLVTVCRAEPFIDVAV